MNKDVIYIEPEHDITDILSKLTGSEQKVVALVPPKKAGVLRSAVNIKLIAKTARDAKKVAVLVTADPALVKLAATARIPVAKTLQSRPEIPTEAAVTAAVAAEQVIEEDLSKSDGSDEGKTSDKPPKQSKNAKSKPARQDDVEEDLEPEPSDAPESAKNAKDAKKQRAKAKVPSIEKYRKWIIIGAVAVVAIVGFLIWALIFAPAVKISIGVKTSANNFSENVSFTTKSTEENLEEGKFLLEEQKLEKKNTVQFTATGQKDVGNKASGQVIAYVYLRSAGSVNIPSGSVVSYNGLQYTVTTNSTITWDGDDEKCESGSSISSGCLKSTKVNIEASAPGTQYNIGAQETGWSSNTSASIRSESAISGGTSDIKTVVTQADVDKAKAGLASADDADGKSQLKDSFNGDWMAIESSFKQSVGDPVSSPAIGEEVPSGTTPSLTVTTTLTMYAVDKVHIGDYIKSKVKLADDQEVYSVGEPYFERFNEGDGGALSGKLKTTAQIGPKVSNEDVMGKAKGRKIGEVQSLLKSINGVSDVRIDRSFFWVNSVPNDPNKITIDIEIEENQ